MNLEQLQFELTQPMHDTELWLERNPHFGELANPRQPAKRIDLPYTSHIVAGKNTYAYDAHTYHTKVPPQGIRLLIDYYTRPGDVVLDPFCGSGMTAVAATELGRAALLSDISPAAVFIAYNLNSPIDSAQYLAAIREMLKRSESLEEKLYSTHCRRCAKRTPMLYMVWSYGYLCPHCGKEFVLWDVARDEKPSVRESKILNRFPCPHCHEMLQKRSLKRTGRSPVQVGYKCCEGGLRESCFPPDDSDAKLLHAIESEGVPPSLWYPADPFPEGVNTRQPIAAGITSVDKCYTPRGLYAMAHLWQLAQAWPDTAIREKLLFTLTSLYQRVTLFSEFRFWGGSGNTANYNVPGIINEQNVFQAFKRKAGTISWYFREASGINRRFQVSVQSACCLGQIADESIDYVFTDPPFGGNINYSEMNFLWESWLRKHTNNHEEAIVNPIQGKGYAEYQTLLRKAFQEVRRVLKNNAWCSVVFHNSSQKAWASIQNALCEAGLQVLGTQTFDKKHGTFKMFVSDNAVGYDIVLHCRKAGQPFSIAIENHESAETQIMAFIRNAIHHGNSYVTKYLHVARPEEFNYRQLYSEWLTTSIPNQLVTWDFETFRNLVDQALKEKS